MHAQVRAGDPNLRADTTGHRPAACARTCWPVASTFATRCRHSLLVQLPCACMHPRSMHPRMRRAPRRGRGNQDHSSNVLLGKRLKFTFHTKMFASLLYLNNTVRYKIPVPGRYGPWTRVYGPFLGLWSTPCFNWEKESRATCQPVAEYSKGEQGQRAIPRLWVWANGTFGHVVSPAAIKYDSACRAFRGSVASSGTEHALLHTALPASAPRLPVLRLCGAFGHRNLQAAGICPFTCASGPMPIFCAP